MTHSTTSTCDHCSSQVPSQAADPQPPEIHPFLETAGTVTKLFFAGVAALGAVGSFCVGIAFTPFSQEAGIAAFAIGTSLFGLAGILLYNAFKPHAAPLSSRDITSF